MYKAVFEGWRDSNESDMRELGLVRDAKRFFQVSTFFKWQYLVKNDDAMETTMNESAWDCRMIQGERRVSSSVIHFV